MTGIWCASLLASTIVIMEDTRVVNTAVLVLCTYLSFCVIFATQGEFFDEMIPFDKI